MHMPSGGCTSARSAPWPSLAECRAKPTCLAPALPCLGNWPVLQPARFFSRRAGQRSRASRLRKPGWAHMQQRMPIYSAPVRQPGPEGAGRPDSAVAKSKRGHQNWEAIFLCIQADLFCACRFSCRRFRKFASLCNDVTCVPKTCVSLRARAHGQD